MKKRPKKKERDKMDKSCRKASSQMSREERTDLKSGKASRPKVSKGTAMALAVCFTLLFTAFAGLQYGIGDPSDQGDDNLSNMLPPAMAAPNNTWVVTTSSDSGEEGSLRSIIYNAGDGDLITFDPKVDWGASPIVLRYWITFSHEDLIIDGGAGVTLKGSFGYRLMYSSATNGTLTLSGLTFEGSDGGGLAVLGEVFMTNCKFIDNRLPAGMSGAGVWAQTATMIDCTFTGNRTSNMNGGGAVIAENATLINCTFTDNYGYMGGGLSVRDGTATLTNCTFRDNSADESSGALNLEDVIATLTNCTFIDNEAVRQFGGAVRVADGDLTMVDCKFTDNAAGMYGGAVFSYSGDIYIDNCIFRGNTAVEDGSAVYARGNGPSYGHITVADSAFAYNTSEGSTVYSVDGNVTASNTTFYANAATRTASAVLQGDVVTITHCTFTDNRGSFNISASDSIIARNNLMTADRVGANADKPLTGSGNQTRTHALAFGNNVLTFNYIMPVPNIVNVPVLSGHEKDAAGNLRTSSKCLPGAINWDAYSFLVTNGSDSGPGSVRDHLGVIHGYNRDLASWFVIHFADDVKQVNLASPLIYDKAVMMYGRLDKNGEPDVTLDGGGRVRVIEHKGYDLSNNKAYFYGLNIQNGYTPLKYGGAGIMVLGAETYVESCNFIGNRSVNNESYSYGGGLSTQGLKVSVINSKFINNSSIDEGGGAYFLYTPSLVNCVFAYNKSDIGGGLGVSDITNKFFAIDCVFTGNEARLGGAVYFNTFASASMTIGRGLINSTISENITTGPNSGAFECGSEVHIIQTTISNNIGGGLRIMNVSSSSVYLYNSIIAGNVNIDGTTPQDVLGDRYTNVSSLIGGKNAPGSAVPVTGRQVFGMNTFDHDTGTHSVLSNGIAYDKAAKVTELSGTKITPDEKVVLLNVLKSDQRGIPRTGTSVSYGSSEMPGYWLTAVSVTKAPDTIQYMLNETIVLTGTEITLDYSNGSESPIQYTEPGMTNTSSKVDMSTPGEKRIDFIFLGVSTKDDTCLRITAESTYDLTYDLNGGMLGTGPKNVTQLFAQNGYVLDAATVPTHSGDGTAMLFIGWTQERDEKIYAKKDPVPMTLKTVDIVDENVTVYAVWSYDTNDDGIPDVLQKWYDIIYNANGGSGGPETVSVLNGTYGMSAVVPAHTGALFIGWTLDNTALDKIFGKGEMIPVLKTDDITVEHGDVILYAVWGHDTNDDGIPDVLQQWFTITYHPNGGIGGPVSQSVVPGEYPIPEIEPTHPEALFIGWMFDGSIVGIVLTKHNAVPMTVKTITVFDQDEIVYAAWGCDDNEDGIPDVLQRWFDVTYLDNGGSGGPGVLSVTSGTYAVSDTEPERTDALFMGWTLDGKILNKTLGKGDAIPVLVKTITVADKYVVLYAVWGYDTNGDGIPDAEQEWYNIMYNNNGGTGAPGPQSVVPGMHPVSEIKPTKTNALFMGWTLDNRVVGMVLSKGNEIPAILSEVRVTNGNVTLYAVWGYDTNGDGIPDALQGWYNIIYNPNGGTGAPKTQNTVSGIYPIPEIEPTKAGALFMGWTYDVRVLGKVLGKGNEMPIIISEITVAGGHAVIYAVWGYDTNDDGIPDVLQQWFNITYHVNGGSNGPGAQSVPTGTHGISAIVPTHTRAVFIGWTLEDRILGEILGKNCTVPVLETDNITVVGKDVILYAVWGHDENGDNIPDVLQQWFNITYNINGGTGGPGPQSVVPGIYPISTIEPTYEGLLFMGGTLDRSIVGKVLGKGDEIPVLVKTITVVDKDVVVYAVWGYDTNDDGIPDAEQKWFNITYNINGGTGGPGPQSVVPGIYPISTIEPTYNWMIFMGGTLDETIFGKRLGKGDEIPVLIKTITVVDKDVVIYAVWGYDDNEDGIPDVEQDWFNIIYNINGGTGGPASQNVVPGIYPISKTKPTYNGFIFIGWTLETVGKVLGKGDTMPVLELHVVTVKDDDVILYAVWGHDENGDGIPDVLQQWFNVTYLDNGGSDGPGIMNLAEGTYTVSKKDPKRTGFIFMGWTLEDMNGKTLGKGDTMPETVSGFTVDGGDVILYAVWGSDDNEDGIPDVLQQWFNIIYNVNGGSGGPETQSAIPGAYPVSTIEPTYAGAVFMGWTIDRSVIDKVLGKGDTMPVLKTDDIIVINSDVFLYAVWGHDDNEDGIPDVLQQWFNIIYNVNGGSGGPEAQSAIPGTHPISAIEPTYATNVLFIGWTLDKTMLDKVLSKGDTMPALVLYDVTVTDSDVILYAVWGHDTNGDGKPDAEQDWFSIIYDANGGHREPRTMSVIPGTYPLSATKPLYHGVLFMGWTIDDSIAGKKLGKGDAIPDIASNVTVTDSDVILYAVWGYDTNGDGKPDAEQDWFSITYNVNGGSGGPETQSVLAGTYEISKTEPMYTGVMFMGWTIDNNVFDKVLGKGDAIPDIASNVTVTDSDVILYAIWGHDTNDDGIPDALQQWFNVTYHVNGGSGGPGVLNVPTGTHLVPDTEPTHPDALFVGWTRDHTILGKILGKYGIVPELVTEVGIVDSDVTIYAIWGYDTNGDGIPDVKENWFDIIYNVNGGYYGPETLNVIFGTYPMSTVEPEHAYALFMGWTLDHTIQGKILGIGDKIPVFKTDDITVTNGDVILYAVWGHDSNGDGEPDVLQQWFNIIYHPNYGSGGPGMVAVVPGIHPVSDVKPSYLGVIFMGWTLDSSISGKVLGKGGVVPELETEIEVVDGDVTLYAVWGRDTNDDNIPDVLQKWFNIIYHPNYGSGGPGMLSVIPGTYPVSDMKPLRTGSLFVGWTLDSSIFGKVLSKGDEMPVLASEVTVVDGDVTLYAIWGYDANGDGEPDVIQDWFDIIYNVNGGMGGPAPQNVLSGTYPVSDVKPVRMGLIFMGWTLDSSVSGKVLGKGGVVPELETEIEVVDADVVLYAVWGRDTNSDGEPDVLQKWFDISYNNNKGSGGPGMMNVVPGTYMISAIKPTHASAIFLGWTLDSSIFGKVLVKGGTIPELETEIEVVDDDVILYAVWGRDTNGDGIPDVLQKWFNITYNSNSGSGGPGMMSVVTGTYPVSTIEPTYTGALFVGWTLDSHMLGKVLYKGGTIPELETEIKVVDDDVVLYAVWGYDTNDDGIPDVEQKWFNIRYNVNGGIGGPKALNVVPGTYPVSTIEPTYTGALFVGWTLDISVVGTVLSKGDAMPVLVSDVTVIDGDVTLYAVWGYDANGDGEPDVIQDWFNITYDDNGGAGGPGKLSVLAGTHPLSGAKPSYPGAIFIGWTLDISVVGTVLSKGDKMPVLALDVTVTDSDVILYAVWGYDENEDGEPDVIQDWFTITYHANDGSGGPGKLSVVPGVYPISAAKPLYSGMIFMGWTLDTSVIGKVLGKGDKIPVLATDVTVTDSDVILYAVWGHDENGDGIPDAEQKWFTITYHANGGSGEPITLSVLAGTYPVTIFRLSHPDAVFIGWTLDGGILGKVLGKGDAIPVLASDITIIDSDVILYAVWGYDENGDGIPDALQKWFDITYHANDGSGGPGMQNVLAGTYPLSAAKPSYPGTIFIGWTLDISVIGKVLSKGDAMPVIASNVIVIDDDVILYAVWGYDENEDGIPDALQKWFSITYNDNGGSGGPGKLSVVPGTYATSSTGPAHTGALFIGWTLDVSVIGKVLSKGDAIPVSALDVTVTDSDVILYAVWGYDENGDGIPDAEQKWFTITYHANGGIGAPGTLSVAPGTYTASSIKPTFAGFSFMGWTLDDSVIGKLLDGGDMIPEFVSNVIVIDDDVILYAVWGHDNNYDGIPDVLQPWFNITYDDNGGSGGPGVLNVLFGKYAISSIEPKYAGAMFMGWTLDRSVLGTVLGKGDTIPVLEYRVTVTDGDVVLYAVWGYDDNEDGIPDAEQKWYTLSSTRMASGKIQWSLDGVKYSDLSGTASVLANATVYMKATAGLGMRFYAWTNDLAGNEIEKTLVMNNDKVVGAIFHGADDPTLYSSYSAGGNIQWSVDGDAWDDLPSVLVIPADQTSVFLKVVIHDGYRFYSWTGDLAGNEVTVELFLGSDKTVRAEFRPVSEPAYTLTSSVSGTGKIQWSVDGRTYADLPVSLTVPAGATVRLKAAAGEGTEFFGWTGDLAGTLAVETLLMNSDRSVCAVFTDGDIGSAEDDDNGHGRGLSLIWWFLLALLMFLIIFFLIRDRFTLTYDRNGGTQGTGPGKKRGLVAQEDLELDLMNVPEHADHIGRKVAFVGWSAEPDGKIYSMADSMPATITTVDLVDRDVTVYAVWGYDTNGDGIPDVKEYSVTSTVAGGAINRAGIRPPDFHIKERRRR